MIESIYNLTLFSLAIVGALRAGVWIVGRGWQWYWKALALIVTASAVIGFAKQATGGPVTDMRAVTEVLATAGCIFAIQYGFRHVRNGWARFAFVAAAGVFLFVTWSDSVDRAMGTVKSIAPSATTSQPTSVPNTSQGGGISKSALCADSDVTEDKKRNVLNCY